MTTPTDPGTPTPTPVLVINIQSTPPNTTVSAPPVATVVQPDNPNPTPVQMPLPIDTPVEIPVQTVNIPSPLPPVNTPTPAPVNTPAPMPRAIPSQSTFPGRAVIRTIVAVLIATLALLNTVVPIIQNSLSNSTLPARDYLWINGVAVAIATISGIITRIMAVPGVDSFLAKLNLSATK